MKKFFYRTFSVFLFIFVFDFSLKNTDSISFYFLNFQLNIPLVLLLFIFFFFGILVGSLISLRTIISQKFELFFLKKNVEKKNKKDQIVKGSIESSEIKRKQSTEQIGL